MARVTAQRSQGSTSVCVWDKQASILKEFEELRELVLVEEFKNCLPERVVT